MAGVKKGVAGRETRGSSSPPRHHIKEKSCSVFRSVQRNAHHGFGFINDGEPGLHEDYEGWLEELAPTSRFRVPPQGAGEKNRHRTDEQEESCRAPRRKPVPSRRGPSCIRRLPPGLRRSPRRSRLRKGRTARTGTPASPGAGLAGSRHLAQVVYALGPGRAPAGICNFLVFGAAAKEPPLPCGPLPYPTTSEWPLIDAALEEVHPGGVMKIMKPPE